MLAIIVGYVTEILFHFSNIFICNKKFQCFCMCQKSVAPLACLPYQLSVKK
jgi:hypothetical protein